MCYYTLFKMSVKEFKLTMPEWDKPETYNGLKVMKSRIKAFIDFKKEIIEWLKSQKKIDEKTAKDQIETLGDKDSHQLTLVPFIQNLTNIPDAVTKIESQTSSMFGSGDVRRITHFRNKELSVDLTFDNPTTFNETMVKFHAAPEFIDNYGYTAGRTWGNELFPKEKTQFLITINSSKIPDNYSPEKYPKLTKGGRRKSRKVQKKRYSRRVASRKYQNRK